MKYTDLQIKQKIDELWGGGGVPDYTTMPAYKLKKASKNGKKFFVPSNEPTPKGVEAVEGKSPHKKGSKKYKKHMAAMHAESQEGRWAIYIDDKDTQVRFKNYADAGEMQDKMEAKHPSKKIELRSVGINEEEFGGRFITQDFNDILRDPMLKLPKNINYNNFLNFMEYAMTDSQYKGLTLEQFGDKLKMIFSQWKANSVHGLDKRNRKGSIPDPIKPTVYRTPEGKVPSDADKWFMIESEAKEKLSTYPSKYQDTWALKKYKDAGGTWSK